MRSKIIILSSLLIACVLILISIQKSLRQSPTSSIREYVRPETSSQKTEPASKPDATVVNHDKEKTHQVEVQAKEKEVNEKEINEGTASLESTDALSSIDNHPRDENTQKSTKPGNKERAQPASDNLMRTVTIGGKEYQVKVGESITVTHETPGTWNPRPMTDEERKKLTASLDRLKNEGLSGQEIMEISEEIRRIVAETSYPGTATSTVRIVKNKDK